MHKLKIALRNARKNGVLTFAKIFGLTLSIAVILFAVAYVYYETSFDKNIPDYERIYRCLMKGQLNDEAVDYSVTSWAQAEGMVNEMPEVIEATRLWGRGLAQITNIDNNGAWGELVCADTSFFSFFGIPYISNTDVPLATERDMAIANNVAEILFGSAEDALGKTVTLYEEDYTITAVFNDLPSNSHMRIRIIQSMKNYPEGMQGWNSQALYTYFMTQKEITNTDDFDFRLTKLVYSHTNDQVDAANAQTWEDLKGADNRYVFYRHEPLSEIHFSSHKFDMAVTSNKTYVYGAIVLSILVLLISTINFVNLSNASISTRLKELGIRKTIGAYRSDIIYQFLLETLLFVVLSFALAIVLYTTLGQMLIQHLGFEIALGTQQFVQIVFALLLILLLINLLLTLLPIRMSVGRTITSKGLVTKPGGKSQFSKGGLILVQFVLSGLIVLCTVIVQKQINFFAEMDRGYDPNNILVCNMWEVDSLQRATFLQKMKTYPVVQEVASSSVYFGGELGMTSAFFETDDESNYFHPSVARCSDGFPEVFGLSLKEGRFIDETRQADDDAILVNEAAEREYSGEGSLIGKDIILNGRTYEVIGIIKDFNFRTLHHQIEPLAMVRSNTMGNVYIKIANDQVADFTELMKKEWEESRINFPFNLRINDEVIAARYDKEQEAKKILKMLSIISILIACVGLYAVSFFTIVRKTKEIGVRKVNGAKVTEVMTTLNKQFLRWVLFSLLIASPIAWYIMHRWLENFAYRTQLSWWVFALTSVVTLCIAFLTVSWQSWRAASRNPVEALRYE